MRGTARAEGAIAASSRAEMSLVMIAGLCDERVSVSIGPANEVRDLDNDWVDGWTEGKMEELLSPSYTSWLDLCIPKKEVISGLSAENHFLFQSLLADHRLQ